MARVKTTWHGPNVLKREREAAGRGLTKGAEFLLDKARRLAPHEKGDLERSGTASVDKQQLRAAISFDRPYAVEQHENLAYRHDEGRQAKYLEEPMNDRSNHATMMKIFQAEIRRGLS